MKIEEEKNEMEEDGGAEADILAFGGVALCGYCVCFRTLSAETFALVYPDEAEEDDLHKTSSN